MVLVRPRLHGLATLVAAISAVRLGEVSARAVATSEGGAVAFESVDGVSP